MKIYFILLSAWGRPHLTFSFTSLKIEFNFVIVRHMAVSIQLSYVNNIFKATVLKATQEIVEYYHEYRRKTYKTLQFLKSL